MDLILERVGVTILLSVYSLVLALGIAIPLGVLAAIRANTSIDRAALGVAVFGQAIPNFWFGLILI